MTNRQTSVGQEAVRCELCEKEGVAGHRAFAKLIPGDHPVCAPHLRMLIETLRFLASEGGQKEEDIEAQLTHYDEEYPWPKKVSE